MGTRVVDLARAALVAASLFILLGALGLTACGGSGTTAASTSSAAPSAAAVTTSPSPSWSPTVTPAPIPVVKPGQKVPAYSELKKMFAYDTSEPLDYKELTNLDQTVDGIKFRCVTIKTGGELVPGFLALPQGTGPFPVVVYAPGSNTEAMMWSTVAAALAKKGYAGLLLEESGGPFWTYDGMADGQAFVRYTIDARRVLDLLATMPEIDMTRAGFVAWSNGCRLGSFLSGVDDRFRTFVFDGLNNQDITTWTAAEKRDLKARGVDLEAYAAQQSIFDPAVYFSRNRDARFLFMWGDEEITPAVKQWYLAAAPRNSAVHMFSGGHGAPPAAMKYLTAWVEKNL
jgi:hypothetical protein